MNTYLIPTDEDIIESVAKSIARSRMQDEAHKSLTDLASMRPKDSDDLDGMIDQIFEQIWAGSSEHDEKQKDAFRGDALAAIRTINLKLMTTA
jgi:hypothetical protein